MSAHIVREAAGPEPCQDRKKEGKGHIAVPAPAGAFRAQSSEMQMCSLRALGQFSSKGSGKMPRCACSGEENRDICMLGMGVMVLSQDRDRGRVTLSTKKLEPTPGDMLRDPQRVFENADLMAETFRKRVEAAELSARSDPNSLNPMAAVLDPSEMNPMFSSVDYQQADPAAGENYTY
eukprot:scaffold69414_cov18-Tisochrysis_lutea.AAC.1